MADSRSPDPLPLPCARFLSREQSAAYLGVGVTTFDAEVKSGMWPSAFRRGGKGGSLTWDRLLLDRAADRLGQLIDATAPGADLKAAEQAALDATARGTPASNRHKHRHQKAA